MLSLDTMLMAKVNTLPQDTLKPPRPLQPMSSVESLTYGAQPVEILEARRITIAHVRTLSL